MQNFDFNDILNKKFNGDPKKVLDEYEYDYGDAIFKRIDSIEEQNYHELNDIANMIVLWKINRTPTIDKDSFDGLLDIKKIQSKESAIEEQNIEKIKSVLESLIKSKGVRLAMASTFLHFFNKECFPIFDQRAYRVIYEKEYESSTSVKKQIELYIDYLKECNKYYETKELKQHGIGFADIDKFLYQLDKEAGNKANNYGGKNY